MKSLKNPFKRITEKSKKFTVPKEKATTDTIDNTRKQYKAAQSKLRDAYKEQAHAYNKLNSLITKLQDITLPQKKKRLVHGKSKRC